MRLEALLTLACAFALHASLVAAEEPYKFLQEIPIGGEGGWDYLSVDSEAHRLFVTHASKVVAVDLSSDSVAGEIADTPGVHGFAVAAELGRGFASNGRDNSVSVVDLKTLQTTAKIATGENPDAILFEPGHAEVYAFNGRGKSATVIDAKSGAVTATIPLPGKPEFAAADPEAGRVYCNIEDTNEVVVIDTAKHEMVATWPIAPGKEASGMAFDRAHHRLFLGCTNKMMVMMDSGTGKVLANVPIGAGVDACEFDPETQLAFASSGDGTVTIAKEEAPDKLSVVQTLTTEKSARTMTLDPATHRIYLASAKFGPAPSPGADGRPQRPPVLPESFKVLVYGPGE